jgi:hypothetical protein
LSVSCALRGLDTHNDGVFIALTLQPNRR